MLTLVWLIRSLSVSVVCLLLVVPCQTVCSEWAFPVCGTNVTFVLVRVIDCFFCLSDWYSVVKLQSALAGAIQKSSILLTLPVYSSRLSQHPLSPVSQRGTVLRTGQLFACLVRFLNDTVLRNGQSPSHHHRASWSQPCRESGPRHLSQQPSSGVLVPALWREWTASPASTTTMQITLNTRHPRNRRAVVV